MKLSKSLLGAILVGASLGVTAGCAPKSEVTVSPEIAPKTTTVPEETIAPDVTTPDSHGSTTVTVDQPQLQDPNWIEDNCPGCGRG